MADRQSMGVISIGSNDLHVLVAASDGIGTFDRHANQPMLAELVSAVKGGVVPAKALGQALQDLEALVKTARNAGASPIIAIATEALREVANGPGFIDLIGTTLGITAVLISGEEEAALDYCWATFPPVPPTPLRDGVHERTLRRTEATGRPRRFGSPLHVHRYT
jgi:exopolyphosphatase/pppGpp-phosphohydrolase